MHNADMAAKRIGNALEVSLAELKERAHINARAKAADKEADFSRLIRKGIPGME